MEPQEKYTKEQLGRLTHAELLPLIDKIKSHIKTSKTCQEMFDNYGVDIDELDYVPVCFSKLDTSARTNKGVIYLNLDLLRDGSIENDDHYILHELRHYLQQTAGDHPTQGSDDDNYLDNPYEIDGFNQQTKYLSETRGVGAAEKYIDKVLDYHEVPKKDREKRKEQLLELASQSSGLTKNSGLLKVPPKLIEDVTNYIIGVYAGKVKEKAESVVNRFKNIETDREVIHYWEGVANSIKNALFVDVEDMVTEYGTNNTFQLECVDPGPDNYEFYLQIKKDSDKYSIKFATSTSTVKLNITNLDYKKLNDIYYSKVEPQLRRIYKSITDISYNFSKRENPRFQVETHLLIKECDKYAIGLDQTKTQSRLFKYSDYFGEQFPFYLTVSVFFDKDLVPENHIPENPEDEWSGRWIFNGAFNNIYVMAERIAESVKEFKTIITNLKSTARHELQHLIQYQLADQLELSEKAGLPSKKLRQKDVDHHGISSQNKRAPHELRDIEFYTNLTDQVDRFNNIWGNANSGAKGLIAAVWVGAKSEKDIPPNLPKEYVRNMEISPFFELLKTEAPLKWRKAVIEFFKAIDI